MELKTKNIIGSSFLAIGIAMTLTGCNQDHDLYDSSIKDKEYAESFEKNVLNGGTIDPNQTWNASVMTELSVAVNLNVDEEYTIQAFTANPNYDAKATLLDQVKAKTGTTAVLNFARPQATTIIYLAAVNSKNRFDVTAVDVTGDKCSATLGGDARSRAISRATVMDVNTDPSHYIIQESSIFDNSNITGHTYFDISSLTEAERENGIDETISGGAFKHGDGKHYEIPAGKTVEGPINYTKGRDNNCIILVKGTWEINGNQQSIDNGQVIVVDNGGKIVFNTDLKFTSGSRLINRGTIETSSNSLNFSNASGTIDCYNSGTMSLNNGGIILQSTPKLYNSGTMTMKYINAAGTFTNIGTFTAETTKKDSNTVSGQEGISSNFDFINGCHASIDAFGVHNLILCDNSRLDCKTGIATSGGQNGIVSLGKFSVVSAKDWTDNGGKFYGSSNSNEPSVFQFTGKVIEKNGSAFATEGFVYFDGDLNSDDWHIKVISGKVSGYPNHITHTTKEENSEISISKGDCTGDGYNPKNDPAPEPEPNPTRYIYAFEDMGTIGDFDFNDVVLGVDYPIVAKNGSKTANIVLLAAGGTLPISVNLEDNTICNEVHEAFGVSQSTMVNTGGTKVEAKHLITLSNLDTDFDPSNAKLSITVKNGSTSVTIKQNNAKGEVPRMIQVPGTWKWPTETTNISKAYPTEEHSFGEWGENYDSDNGWYDYPADGKVVIQ